MAAHPQPLIEPLAAAWDAVLAARARADFEDFHLTVQDRIVTVRHDGSWIGDVPRDVARLLDLYLPLARLGRDERPAVIAILGMSLDGRIATVGGNSHYINGHEGLVHLHRLRALADAVLVGGATVANDDPRLTVRHCAGVTKLRVVIDTHGRLDDRAGIFQDGAAETLLVRGDQPDVPTRHGKAEVLALPRAGAWIDGGALLSALGARGVRTLLVEGGGITVSRFLAARLVDVLHLEVAPMIIGSGRAAITLPEITELKDALRPPTRAWPLGEDTLLECRLT